MRSIAAVLGAAVVPVAIAGMSPAAASGEVAGGPASVRCAFARGDAMGACAATVERGAAGDTRVTVSHPNGFARTLRFDGDRFVRANATMSGVGTDTDWRLEDGRHLIRVESQRYEVPAALVSGE